jgi:hypothetical protein
MTQAVALAQQASTGVSQGFKNRIINGAMVIDQRNAGASVTIPATGSQYTLDRWTAGASQASKYSVQQNAGSVTSPAGFTNYLGVTSLSAYSVLSTDLFYIIQRIEGFNTADLNFGSASAKTITISFWVRSSLTGTFGGTLRNDTADRFYPFSYTISVANTWEQKSITIAGDTTGTWVGATNGIGLAVYFSIGVGSTYSGTAGSWGSTAYYSATGATSVVGTNGATFYITGVQLEVGSTATSFDYRPYSVEYDMCRRYFELIRYASDGSTNQYIGAGVGMAWDTNDQRIALQYYPKRANPTGLMSGSIRFATSAGGNTLTSYLFDTPGVNTLLMYNNTTSGLTRGNALQVTAQTSGTFISFSAEL